MSYLESYLRQLHYWIILYLAWTMMAIGMNLSLDKALVFFCLFCYVEFHPEHSLLFSDVLHSHMTSFHTFHPNSPLRNINTLQSPQPFCCIPESAPHSSYQSRTHYALAIAEPSQNLLGSYRMASEVSWIHLGTFTISIIHQHYQRFQYCIFYFSLYYYSVLALSLVV